MSLKKNILANYASQIYVSLVGIAILPLYLRHMGAEAYGLVGFFALLQSWFSLLDMGLSTTMAREAARFQGGAVAAVTLRQLLRALEAIFVMIAFAGAISVIFGAHVLSTHWLKVTILNYSEVASAIQIMGVILAFRWISGLFRSVINGFEKQVWLSWFNALIATLRFVGVIPIFVYVGSSPKIFFTYQMIVALFELGVLIFTAYLILPKLATPLPLKWDWRPLKPILKFSLSISFLSVVWVLSTQTDKLILSKFLSLSDYGYFTMAVMAASGIMLISSPISTAILPRLTRLHAEGREDEVIALYRRGTQVVSALAFSTAMVLVFFAKQVLWIWTGNLELSEKVDSVLILYALGNAVLAVAAFPYYLQYAMGDMRLHIYGNILFLVFLIPSVVWLTVQYGMPGAGWAWLCSNAIYLFLWIPVVHHKFARGMHWKWLVSDILPFLLLATTSAFLTSSIDSVPNGKIHLIVNIATSSVVVLSFTLSGLGLNLLRRKISLMFWGKSKAP